MDYSMSMEQLKLARHAIGLPNSSQTANRNSFVCGPGRDNDLWRGMVKDGFATIVENVSWMGGMDLFRLTEKGINKALCPQESRGDL